MDDEQSLPLRKEEGYNHPYISFPWHENAPFVVFMCYSVGD